MNEKTKGVIAYLFGWLGGLIILFGYKDSERGTKVHAAQAIVLSVAYMILLAVIRIIPGIRLLSGLLGIFYLVLAIIGMVKANRLEEYELPVISDLAKNWFAKYIDEEPVKNEEKEDKK